MATSWNSQIPVSRRYWISHILFWAGLFSLLVVLNKSQRGMLITLSRECINLGFYITLVYTNLLFLIPRYLNRQKFLAYLLLMLLTCLLMTPFKSMALHRGGLPEFVDSFWELQAGYFFMFVTVSGFSTIGNIVVDWFSQINMRQQLENRTMQSELQFLRSQINPHFLFNTLNSLYALTLKKSEKAPEMVIKLSDMMRYMLYECNEKKVRLTQELQYLQNYISLEKLRQGEAITIELDVIGDPEDKYIVPLLLIPFLENAFKHSLPNSLTEPRYVKMQLAFHTEMLFFRIVNNKAIVSHPAEVIPAVGGIGLENVNRRLQLLYPKSYELNVMNLPTEYSVTLRLPL